MEENIEKKVNPIAIQFVEDCRAKELTFEEVHTLIQLISWEYEKAKKEADKKVSSELF